MNHFLKFLLTVMQKYTYIILFIVYVIVTFLIVMLSSIEGIFHSHTLMESLYIRLSCDV